MTSTPAQPLLVFITNCVCPNAGDAAIVEATMTMLRANVSRELAFTVLDNHHEATARLYPEWRCSPWPWQAFGSRGRLGGRIGRPLGRMRALVAAFFLGRGLGWLGRPLLRRREWEFLTAYAAADLAVSKGGTYLIEAYDLRPHFFDYRLCHLLRVPVVFGPQTLAIPRGVRNRRGLSRALDRSRVLVRDELSYRSVRDLAPAADVHCVADAAFALADVAAVHAARIASVPPEPRVVVSVREWRHFGSDVDAAMARYAEAVRALVVDLVRDRGSVITFISTCQGVAEYAIDDSRLADSIVSALPRDVRSRVRVDGKYRRPAEMLQELEQYDLAIATRMHLGILALARGVPVFPIAYEAKTVELARRLGLADFTTQMETITASVAVEQLGRFLGALPELRSHVFDAVLRERERALAAGTLMAECLGDVRNDVAEPVRR